MKRGSRFLALVACFCLVVTTSPIHAKAQSADVTLTGPTVVTFTPLGILTGATNLIIHGAKTADGGCSFPMTVMIPSGQQSLAQYELARDTSTCTSLVERGTPVAPGPTTAPSLSLASTSGSTCPPGEFDNGWSPQPYPKSCQYTCEGATGAPGEGHCTTLTLHAYFQDPVGIKTVEAYDTIAWYWPPLDPSCTLVAPGAPNSGWDSHQEYPDGWSVNSHSFTTTAYPNGNGASGGCSAESTSSTFVWQNALFCKLFDPLLALGSQATVVSLNPTTITGNSDGTGNLQLQRCASARWRRRPAAASHCSRTPASRPSAPCWPRAATPR